MPKVHQQIRSLCREEARRIIEKDRKARKYGWSQNTIGEIEQAMIVAYRLGLEGYGDPARKPLQNGIRWDDLPPRSRDLLNWATDHPTVRLGHGKETFHDLQCDEVDGKMRWFVVSERGRSDHSFAQGASTALLKHELIKPMGDRAGMFRITEKGKAVCRDYWQRSADGDRSLPLMNIRA